MFYYVIGVPIFVFIVHIKQEKKSYSLLPQQLLNMRIATWTTLILKMLVYYLLPKILSVIDPTVLRENLS